MSNQFDARFLGILGGMGPMAGAVFMARLIALTPTDREQEHVPAILWSDPRVPERPAAYLSHGEDPLPWMVNGVAQLERAGAKAIVIPCNTAHLWYAKIAATTRLPVLHIVQAVIDDLRRQDVHAGRIGLMATAATLQVRLYQGLLEQQGYTCVLPSNDDIQRYCTEPILQVKQGRSDDAFQSVAAGVEVLRRQGVDAVVLGCTELPVALPPGRRDQSGIPIVDSIDALALAALRWYKRSGQSPPISCRSV